MVDGGSKGLDDVVSYDNNLQSSVEHGASLDATIDDDIDLLKGEAEIRILVARV